MSQERPNCAIAKKLYEGFLAGDLQAIYALLDPRIDWEIVGPGEVPHFGLYRGLDEVKRFFSIIGEINRVESFGRVEDWRGNSQAGVGSGSDPCREAHRNTEKKRKRYIRTLRSTRSRVLLTTKCSALLSWLI